MTPSTTDKPVLDGEYRVEEGANSHAFDLRIIDPSGRCIAFADEPEASQIAAALSAPTKPLPEAGREGHAALNMLVLRAEKIGHKAFRSMSEFDEFVRVVEDARAALKAASPESSVEEAGHKEKVYEHARKMSNALLKVRPLGGSELFVSIRTGSFEENFADPAYCGAAIEKLRSDLHEAKTELARLKKPATPEQGGREAVAWQINLYLGGRWIGWHEPAPDPEKAREYWQALSRRYPDSERVQYRDLFTTPRSEEDIRKAVVEECAKIAEEFAGREFVADAIAEDIRARIGGRQ